MEDLQLSQSEVGDTVRRYCNVLFARWSDELKMFIGCQKRSLVQVNFKRNFLYNSLI